MAFDHIFDHFAKNSLISYPGVAQLVGRLIWVQDAGSSNLPTRTSKNGWFHMKSAVFLTFVRISVSTSGDWPHKSFFSFSEFPESFYISYFRFTAENIYCFHFRVSFTWPLQNHVFFGATRIIPAVLFFVYCVAYSVHLAFFVDIHLFQYYYLLIP